MGFMDRFKKKSAEIRAENDVQTDSDTGSLNFIDWLFGLDGELTREAAGGIPTVSACIQKIADTVSMLPIKMYQKQNNEVSEIVDDVRLKLLNQDTGDTLSTSDMWKAVINDYYLGNGGWIYINSQGIMPKSLHYIDDDYISIMRNSDPIFKSFYVMINGQKYYDFKFIRILRKTKDGFTNVPIQTECRKILSAAYNSLKLEELTNSNGGCKPGFLKSKNRLSREAIDLIKKDYKNLYTADNSEKSKVVVLNDGIDFEAVASTSAELQLNENKKTNSIEICKIFGFPHTVIDGNATETDRQQFISAVISVLNQIETALDLYLLTEDEKEKGFYFAFDTKELTRGSLLQRYQAYEIGLKNRFLQVDEVRKEEDFDPIGFNFVTLGLGDVLINPETKQVYTPNTNKIVQLGESNEIIVERGENIED